MIHIDPRSPVPINEQIKAGLRGLIARGALRPGDPAPSIRGLAESLKVNPNTVARAVRELVIEGVLDARRGEGTVVADAAPRMAKSGLDDVRGRLREALRQARRGGLGWNDVETAVREARREEP
ncbi:MAG: GntR family transcriptional regulator [Elusimicrobia bacterium]|nr:GntR family transcriptional regulator [Elusimicrobiota bacterium]MDE2511685.1 GntR family transcriptional regulator [Elusimicrobiota bacterium]